ncbi:MAG: hypothetical protein SWX82_21520 [Cyanobacteriota bacterium]|nr:hypothetical protein [Cyanobacteriota bacterium]
MLLLILAIALRHLLTEIFDIAEVGSRGVAHTDYGTDTRIGQGVGRDVA